ncbi:YoaK family protein [Duganella sp. P38]|uniref:YoaK family protein n=1 Tax=Duganella sp. P38 TaxID=3423949 RepID=UPI003D790D39
MPMHYLRSYASPQRDDVGNRRLGRSLAFVAGAVNAGGFFAVGEYTSHMSGVVSALADNLVLGKFTLLLAGLGSLLAFFLGAATSAILINWGRRRAAHSRCALPLLLEAALLLAFGLLGARLAAHGHIAATVALLCFVMGLQNAIVSKASRSEIRTTHVTGLVTDIGIELGKLLYWNRDAGADGRVTADRRRLSLLSSLLAMFLGGGLAGAVGFQYLGFSATVPLALALLLLAAVPLLDDVRGG